MEYQIHERTATGRYRGTYFTCSVCGRELADDYCDDCGDTSYAIEHEAFSSDELADLD